MLTENKRASKRARTSDAKSDATTSYRPIIHKGLFAKRFGPVRLTYHTEITLSGTYPTPAWHIFSANGMFDPDITGTGHQPYGFDQYMLQYNHYTVIGAKCNVWTENSSQQNPYWLLIRTAAGTTTLTNRLQCLEAPIDFTRKYIGVRAQRDSHSKVSRGCSIKRFLSQDPMQEDSNAGSAAANPAEGVYFHVGVLGKDAFTSTGSQVLNVSIEYIAIFHEPKEVLPS
jgi:hypothetical protein